MTIRKNVPNQLNNNFMRNSTVRNLLVILFILLLPGFILADHAAVLEELETSMNYLTFATVMAALSLPLLIMFRNKYLGMVSLIGGILPIVAGSVEIYQIGRASCRERV